MNKKTSKPKPSAPNNKPTPEYKQTNFLGSLARVKADPKLKTVRKKAKGK